MTELTPEMHERFILLIMDFARSGDTDSLAEAYDRGFPLDERDPDGNTALMMAAYHGHLETVQMLIARGADINIPNSRNQSPIAGAIFKGEDEVVQALREAGADLDAGTPSARQTAELFGKTELLDEH